MTKIGAAKLERQLEAFVDSQVVRHDDLLAQAESNRTAVLPVVPNRGQIVDRNGRVLATNYSAYTLEITPSQVLDMEATIAQLGELMEITPRDQRRPAG